MSIVCDTAGVVGVACDTDEMVGVVCDTGGTVNVGCETDGIVGVGCDIDGMMGVVWDTGRIVGVASNTGEIVGVVCDAGSIPFTDWSFSAFITSRLYRKVGGKMYKKGDGRKLKVTCIYRCKNIHVHVYIYEEGVERVG